jgi:hypothetical protein
MFEPEVVYDLLEGLDGENLIHAIELFSLAGQLGMANGYFFEKQSVERLDALGETEVFDAKGNLVGTIPHPELFFDRVILGKDERFKFGQAYHPKPKVPKEVLSRLWEIRRILRESLNRRGMDAAREYAIVGELMGGTRLTREEILETVEKNLSGKK